MIVYIVLHKPSSKYLPPVKGYHASTRRELSRTPRIFYEKSHAIFAARWWAKGPSSTAMIVDWETGIKEDWGIVSRPDPERKLSDLRIVPCELRPRFGLHELCITSPPQGASK